MRWATVCSEAETVVEATEAIVSGVLSELGGDAGSVHLVLLFLAPEWHAALDSLISELRQRLPDVPIVGCTGGGLAADGREMEPATGLVALAAHLPDVGVVPFAVTPQQARERTPAEWREALELIPEQQPVFLVMPDPFSVDPQALNDVLDAAFSGCTKVGGLASGGRAPGSHRLLSGTSVQREGAVGVALFGDVRVVPVVAQAARPVGPVLEVTAANGQSVKALDGRPVLEVLEGVFAGLSQQDRRGFQSAAAIGIAPASDRGQTLRVGDFLVRDLLGFNRSEGSLVVNARVEVGDRIQLQIRDAAAADLELRELVDRVARSPATASPAGAVMFSCLGRGARFFGLPDHDVTVVRDKLGAPPLAGFFCNGELGPVRGRTWTHGYTCALALFYPRGWS